VPRELRTIHIIALKAEDFSGLLYTLGGTPRTDLLPCAVACSRQSWLVPFASLPRHTLILQTRQIGDLAGRILLPRRHLGSQHVIRSTQPAPAA
jgi:hypothetical protein